MPLTDSWSSWEPAISMGSFFTYATTGAAVQINVIENYREMVDDARIKKTKTEARAFFLTLAEVYRQGSQRRSHHPLRLQLPAQTRTDRLAALDKTGKSGRITNVNVAHFSTHEMANFSYSADKR